MLQLHHTTIGTENAGSPPRPIDRIPQPGEVIFYRRYHHGKQKEEAERLTVIPNPENFWPGDSLTQSLIHFQREDKTVDCIIAKFRCHIPVGGPDEFNKFLFWD